MIKDDGFTVALGVAGSAFVPVAPFMRVVFLVAAVTVHGSVFEGRCGMAFLAISRFMLSYQGKA